MTDTLYPVTANARIIHKRGDTFDRSFQFQTTDASGQPVGPIDFGTGATARMVIKECYDDAEVAGAVLLEWTSANGDLGVVPASGQIDFAGPAADMNPTWSRAVYDIEVTHGTGAVKTYMSGPFELLDSVAS